MKLLDLKMRLNEMEYMGFCQINKMWVYLETIGNRANCMFGLKGGRVVEVSSLAGLRLTKE